MKKRFLELLDKDLEFRYAVAGYLGLSEVLRRLDAIEESIKKLWENQNKLWEEVRELRRDFRESYERLDKRLSRVERTLEKITPDVEEEARIVLEYRLREMGYEINISPLIIPGVVEVNIYGASDDLCVIGDATVRASSKAVDEVNDSVERLKNAAPDRLRPRILKVVYTCLALPDLIERAEKEGVWVLKATGDIVKPKI